MRKSIIALTSVLALGVAACETTAPKESKMAAPEYMSAEALQKAFSKGSITCKWTKVDGTSGQDFYYKLSSTTSGEADRNIGADTIQGKWKISGPAFYTNFGPKKKSLGTWYKVAKTGKKSFDMYTSDGKKAISLKC